MNKSTKSFPEENYGQLLNKNGIALAIIRIKISWIFLQTEDVKQQIQL